MQHVVVYSPFEFLFFGNFAFIFTFTGITIGAALIGEWLNSLLRKERIFSYETRERIRPFVTYGSIAGGMAGSVCLWMRVFP